MFKFVFLFVLSFQFQMVLANSEPPKEKAPQDFSGSQNDEWTKIQAELGKQKGKLDNQEKIVTELLKAKRSVEGSISPAEIANLNTQHEKLQELTKEYNKLLEEFHYRFPEKGQAGARKYIRQENQSLDQMEKNLSLEGRLKKLQKKIKAQYAPEPIEKSEVSQPAQTHSAKPSTNKPAAEKVKNIDITEKITFEK